MLPNSERRRSVVTARRRRPSTTSAPAPAPAPPPSTPLLLLLLSSCAAAAQHAIATPASASTGSRSSSKSWYHRAPAWRRRRPSVPASLLRSILLGSWLMAVSISAHQTNDFRHWPSLQQELSDELHDAEMLSAVQASVGEWERHRHAADHPLHNRVRRADKSVCYGDLGCFEDSGPFGYLDMLPSPPEEINTKFLFYSTKNRSDRPLVEIPYLNMTDAWKVFEPQNQPRKSGTRSWEALRKFEGLDVLSVRVIVHGFGSSCPHVWIYELRTALMAVEDCVVICVDWELGANLPNYVRAAANTRLIGKQLAMFLRGLQQYKGLDLSRVHIIGFSLGAHVSGFAGAELPGISRITGLDPAGPLFESQHPKARLDSTDANFVDVIHSNGENLILGGLGSWQPMGHVDFYPNGGRVQHGCSNLFVGAVTDFIWSQAAAVEGRSLCNHRRAYKFFIDSVAPRCLFPAFPCDSYDDFLKGHCFPCDQAQQDDPDVQAKCGNMGYYADRSTGRGQLYLVTREEEPFCAHQFNVDIYSSENDLPLRTLGRLDAILTGDGTLNETFTITEKDDTEFFAGETISRILVPHPALGFPHAIAMRYKSYSGWLSKGLAQWTIQKVVLTDSFGAKRSICRPEISLVSDRYVHLELQSGECELPEESSTTDATDVYSTTIASTESTERSDINKLKDYQYSTSGPYDDDVDRLREKKEIIKLGSSYKISASSSSAASDPDPALNGNGRLPWQPVLENSIDDSPKTSTEDSAAVNLSKRTGHESGRSISDTSVVSTTKLAAHEINEPILKSTTQRVSSTTLGVEMKPRENSFFTIQLLPFRLGEFIERAERYARETLFPLFSEAPRLFGLGQSTASTSASSAGSLKSSRQPKYFPSLGELASADHPQTLESRRSQRRVDLPPAFSPTLTVEQPVFNYDRAAPELPSSTTKKPESRTIDDTQDSVTPDSEGRSSKTLPNLLRPSVVQSDRAKSSEEDPPANPYYTSELDALAGPNPIRIELPTYKPPKSHSTSKPNEFPYPFELVDHAPATNDDDHSAPRPAIAESTTTTAPAG